MNNQENQFPQFNYGAVEPGESHPQFPQQEVATEPQPQFVQPMQQEEQPQFGQQVAVEPEPQFAQPEQQEEQPQFGQQVAVEPEAQFVQPMQQEEQPQFGQQVAVEPEPQFAQSVQQEEQPQFGQPMQPQFAQPAQQQGQPLFGQALPAESKKEKKPKKEKQPKVKKEKVSKEKLENGNEKNKKKALIIVIASILAFVMLISGGVLYYFYAAGSKQITAAQILDKISSAQKIEGRITEGNIIGKSGQETQTLQIKDATYSFTRHVDQNRYMYIQASVVNSDDEPVTSKNIIAMTLRPNMKAEWSFLGQKGSYQTTGKEKETLEQFVTQKNSDAQKNLGELRTFLLNGYSPSFKVEGKKTTISMNKDDLEKMARKIEDNVKTDQEKFKKLLAKINSETDANEMIENCKNGELTKFVKEQVLPNIQSFKLEFVFNEVSDKMVVGKMTFQMKPTQDETKTTTEYDIKTETTYTLQ